MSTASFGRLGHLLRGLGLTLVALLALQLLGLLTAANWSDDTYRQLFLERLVTQSPMALVGLLLVLFGLRLDLPNGGRTPLRWLVGLLAIALAGAMVVAVPITINSDRALSDQADQQLASRTGQLAMAKSQLASPQGVDQFVQQAEQSGQLPADATPELKRKLVRQVLERQLKQADQQLQQQKQARDLGANQRRFGGTGTAMVLAIGFALIALVALA